VIKKRNKILVKSGIEIENKKFLFIFNLSFVAAFIYFFLFDLLACYGVALGV